jgi:hypothetical protein
MNGKLEHEQLVEQLPQLSVLLSCVPHVRLSSPPHDAQPGTHAPHCPCEQVWVQGQVELPHA